MVTTTTDERRRERNRFVWLFNNCQNRVGIPASIPPDADKKYALFEERVEEAETRALQPADVKVTVKYGDMDGESKLAHLYQIEREPHYKLGIKFERWRSVPPENKIAVLGHELGHVRYSNHAGAYWDFTADIYSHILDHKEHIGSWFDKDVNWDRVRCLMIGNAYENSDHPHREDYMELIANRLGYNADWVSRLEWNSDFTPISGSDDTTNVDVRRVDFSRTYSDEELIGYWDSLDNYKGINDCYDTDPIVVSERDNGKIAVVENEILAALLHRLHEGRLQYDRYDATIPVVFETETETGAA